MQERAVAVDAQGREWRGWWVDPDEWTPDGHEAFLPDDPPDGDRDGVWYVPSDAIRRVADPPADRGALG